MSDHVPVVLVGSERFLTVSQAASRLSVSRQRVHQLMRRQVLGAERIGHCFYVRESDVIDRLESRLV